MKQDVNSDVREHYVYRAYNWNGELLYIGCTKNLKRRWAEHKCGSYPFPAVTARIKTSGPYTYQVARQLEREALATEEPMYGYTPMRHKAHRSITKAQTKRALELMRGGALGFVEAHTIAIREIPSLPQHNRFEVTA